MTRALILVDVQHDFCEGGSLPVGGGNDVAKMFKKSPAMDNIAGAAAAASISNGEGFHFSMTPDINFNFGASSLANQATSNGISQFS